MEKITEIEVNGEKHIIIELGNETFRSMPKWVYEQEQAAKQTGTIS